MQNASKKWSVLLIALALFAVVAAACQAAPDTTTDGGEVDEQVAELQAQLTAAAESGVDTSDLEQQLADAQATAQAAIDAAANATEAPAEAVDRNGGWFDTIVAVEEPNADAAIERLLAGDLDAYLYAVGDPEVYAKIVDNDEALDWWPSYGLSDEFTFNTAEFTNGELNPFTVPAMREAVNWLIDRDHIVNEILGGLGVPRYTAVSTVDPDYVAYIDLISALDAAYAYNPDKAQEVFDTEMEALGATKGDDGKYMFNDAPVDISILIRTEDKRREIGDYLATQLESVGFTVTRDYKNRTDAGACWIRSDPAEGCFHIYTGGWSSTAITLDSGYIFGYWYTPLGGISVNSSTYAPSEALADASDRLWNNQFANLDERRELFDIALTESMKDSTRVWIVDQKTISPYSADFVASGDIAGGLGGSALWAYTMRPAAGVGGAFNLAMPSILDEPWNPIQGSNSLYDAALQRAVSETATVPDPFTGQPIPMRVESATVTHQTDLPIHVTKDWVSLDTADEIEVPGDAWADWDAVEGRFITVEEKFGDEGATALIKSTVVYPADVFETVKWHDGSSLSQGDFVMAMITAFDLGKTDSPYFEPVSQPTVEAFLATFKGVKIVSTDPLTIETYTDTWYTDGELNVSSWWPYYAYGQAPWHTMALGLMAQEAETLAFSADKALELEVEQMSFLSGPSIEVLAANLETATAENYIPYGEALSAYVTTEEATERYANLAEWYRQRGHFWVATGPYFLQRAFPVEGTIILQHNPLYNDPADRWSAYTTPAFPVATVDGPTEVSIGDEASYTVSVTFNDEPYAAEDISRVIYLVFDAEGNLVIQGDAEGGDNGQYTVAFDTSELPEGSNRLQVIVVSKVVGVPVFVNQQFVTTQ